MDSTLTIFGDLCLSGFRIGRLLKQDSWRPFANFSGGYNIANIECALSDRVQPRPLKYANLRAPSIAADCLHGLDLAVLANNHVSDFGSCAAEDTVENLHSMSIATVGYGQSIADAWTPHEVDMDGTRLFVFAASCPTTNGQNLATHTTPGVAPLSAELLRAQLCNPDLPRDALKLVYLHWGIENEHRVVPEQISIAHAAVDWGADAVIGCHGHVIQPYECYRGKHIFYGLGNFLFDDVVVNDSVGGGRTVATLLRQQNRNRESLAVRFRVSRHQTKPELELDEILTLQFDDQFLPTIVSSDQLAVDQRIINLGKSGTSESVETGPKQTVWQSEPHFVSKMRDGILMHQYASEVSVSPNGTDRRRKHSKTLAHKMKQPSFWIHLPGRTAGKIPLLGSVAQSLHRRIAIAKREKELTAKWDSDKTALQIDDRLRGFYETAHRYFYSQLGRFPNLQSPDSFNDRIQWLMLFDQQFLQIECSDKIRVRNFIQRNAGQQYLTQLHGRFDTAHELRQAKLPAEYAVKCNHDSGTVFLSTKTEPLNIESTIPRLQDALNTTYGTKKGEWPYQFVEPKILVEELISQPNRGQPDDFKFHCVDGRVAFIHFICDRELAAREIIFDRDWKRMSTRIHFPLSGRQIERPSNLDEMIAVAEKLAKPFKYVRVDQFCVGSRILVGELTFFPMSGTYQNDGVNDVEPLMRFDVDERRPPITDGRTLFDSAKSA